eukprot:354850-Chlamydomonas_euryale.AAC.5
MTCAAKPPIAPSSMEMRAACSLAMRRSRSRSKGLQKRASTTVAVIPSACTPAEQASQTNRLHKHDWKYG